MKLRFAAFSILFIISILPAVAQDDPEGRELVSGDSKWRLNISQPLISYRSGQDEWVLDEWETRFALTYYERSGDWFWEGVVRSNKRGIQPNDRTYARVGWSQPLQRSSYRIGVTARYETNLEDSFRAQTFEGRVSHFRQGDSFKPRESAVLTSVGVQFFEIMRLEGNSPDTGEDWRIVSRLELDYYFGPRKKREAFRDVIAYPLTRLYAYNHLYFVAPREESNLVNVFTLGLSYQPSRLVRFGIEGRLGGNLLREVPDRYLRLFSTFYF